MTIYEAPSKTIAFSTRNKAEMNTLSVAELTVPTNGVRIKKMLGQPRYIVSSISHDRKADATPKTHREVRKSLGRPRFEADLVKRIIASPRPNTVIACSDRKEEEEEYRCQ